MALVQEEVATVPTSRASSPIDWTSSNKFIPKTALPLPLPPWPDKPLAPTAATPTPATMSVDAKSAAVKTYRRAMGLCYKCGAKWSKDHKCNPQVQLHVVQELWDLLQDEDYTADTATLADSEPQVFLALSQCALTGSSAPRTVQFSGTVQGLPVHILLDSGSSTSFISESVAAQLSQVSVKRSSCQVRITGGGTLTSAVILLAVQWSIGQVSFTPDLRVLPLTAFDMIIGMDWLESFSPMHVHWQLKRLVIPYEGSTVLLQGESVDAPSQLLLQVCSMDSTPDTFSSAGLPPAIQSLLDEFDDLFQAPDSLPPSRQCNHSIPLIPGSQPFYIHPYRYPPALKDEIERQVHEMLSQGLIQPSSSMFSSPVLLVKKKDLSYRFCVDFRKLNSMTVKSKYPVPCH